MPLCRVSFFVMDCSATADPGVLNRAEYIKYLAPFFNREAAANELYDQVRPGCTGGGCRGQGGAAMRLYEVLPPRTAHMYVPGIGAARACWPWRATQA